LICFKKENESNYFLTDMITILTSSFSGQTMLLFCNIWDCMRLFYSRDLMNMKLLRWPMPSSFVFILWNDQLYCYYYYYFILMNSYSLQELRFLSSIIKKCMFVQLWRHIFLSWTVTARVSLNYFITIEKALLMILR